MRDLVDKFAAHHNGRVAVYTQAEKGENERNEQMLRKRKEQEMI